ncbi:MAG: putative baseplate assembly protein [Bryobacteraceae bacterium]|nr:putative baseplate assembly protein [Bryobacteraceae bacterium]
MLQLPQLDDRRWTDIVNESRARIPAYAPEWTDHNASDPGITLLELFAAIAEQNIYWLNRVPRRTQLRFLALLGVKPRDPRPAETLLRFSIQDGTPELVLPEGVECYGTNTAGRRLTFRTRHAIRIVNSDIEIATRREGFWFGLSVPPPPGELTIGIVLANPAARRPLIEEHASLPPHHSVRLAWEVSTPSGYWLPVSAADDTRALTLTGVVRLTLPAAAGPVALPSEPERLWIRARIRSGTYELEPSIQAAFLNAAEADQTQAASSAVPVADAPEPNAVDIGASTGDPWQTLAFVGAPIVAETLKLYSREDAGWRHWQRRDDLIASLPGDAHFTLDAERGEATLGDGNRGRLAPVAAPFVAAYRTTAAGQGNVSAAFVQTLADPELRAKLAVTNPGPAEGGEDAETFEDALRRALESREASLRAVTAEDIAALALSTPGAHIARAEVKVNYAGLACIRAHGVATVLIVPEGPPSPSPGLLRAVAARLERRRVLGTRLIVRGPDYVRVAVRAAVKALPGANLTRLKTAIATAIDAFFHPRTGGPTGTGWPFGRDVYRAEVLQVVDALPEVDHVLTLEFLTAGGESCENVCLPPTGLVEAGTHEIQVVKA